MVGSLTERERFYGSLKTSKITWGEDLYGKPLECDWGGKAYWYFFPTNSSTF